MFIKLDIRHFVFIFDIVQKSLNDMKLLLKRIAKLDKYTIGKLYINGKYFCDVLEDPDRGLSSDMSLDEIKKIKIKGETAIPTGTYKINMNIVSPKFKNRSWAKPYNGKIPRLENVPGYEGVLIHPGSYPEDTQGCLLVGKNTVKGMVTSSQITFKALMDILTKVKDEITIIIE